MWDDLTLWDGRLWVASNGARVGIGLEIVGTRPVYHTFLLYALDIQSQCCKELYCPGVRGFLVLSLPLTNDHRGFLKVSIIIVHGRGYERGWKE